MARTAARSCARDARDPPAGVVSLPATLSIDQHGLAHLSGRLGTKEKLHELEGKL